MNSKPPQHPPSGPSTTTLQPPTPVNPAPVQAPHRRTGKIARLPRDLRDLVNCMLLDGKTYPSIAKELGGRGYQLNPDNLSRWHAGGYQDWLQDQAWLEEMRTRLDFANDVIRQSDGPLLDAASLRIAVTQMYGLLLNFNPATLKNQIASQPGAYSRILNALCNLTEAGLKCERHRLDHPPNNHTTPTHLPDLRSDHKQAVVPFPPPSK